MQVKKGIPIVKHEPTWLEKLLVLLTRRSIEATEQNCYYAALATYDTTAKELQDNGIDTSDCQTIAELIDKYKEYYEKEVAKTLDHYRQVLSDIYDAIVSRGLMFPKDNIDDYADQIRKLKKVDLQIQLSEEIKQVLVDADVKIIDKLTDKVENNLLTPSRYALSESLNSSNLLVTVQNSINITDTLSVTMTHTES